MPRKVFVAGEILTAADVNTNLMDQSVMVFDDATDRATAIPTPVEGMVTYLKDTDRLEQFDGTNFVVAAPPQTGVLQVVSTTLDSGFATASTTFTPVTGLSASITPSLSSSKVFVVVNLMAGRSSIGDVLFNLRRDSTDIAQPNFGSNPATVVQQIERSTTIESISFSFLDNPASTSSLTYQVTARVSSDTLQVNRRGVGDDVFGVVSTITAMEVAG